jgi:hypothetical protein
MGNKLVCYQFGRNYQEKDISFREGQIKDENESFEIWKK